MVLMRNLYSRILDVVKCFTCLFRTDGCIYGEPVINMVGLVDMTDPKQPVHVKLPDDNTNEFRLKNGQTLSNEHINNRLEYHSTNFTSQAWLSKRLKALRQIRDGKWKKDRANDVDDSMYRDPEGNLYKLNMSNEDYKQLEAEWTFMAHVS